MKLKIILSLAFLFYIITAKSQDGLEANLEYNKNINFNFSDEWQYLSTDVYLFNGSKFKDVVNQLSKKRRKEELEFLFVTLELSNVKFFDKEDLVYPIYNFRLEETKSGVYDTHISDNINEIRVIDKLPLSSDDNRIDAKISVKAIAKDKSNEIMQMVATQLTNVAKIANPTTAVLSLVGEYGNLMNSSTSKTEYRFSATIRLYEEQNFDIKLHSVRLYMLTPTNMKFKLPDMTKFTEYIDKTEQPELSPSIIRKLIDYEEYPYLIIANYKSLYRMQGIPGEEITAEAIEKRRQRVNKDYNLKLMKKETYNHEKLYLEYLSRFNELKNNLNGYKLNYDIRNTEAIKKNVFAIVQSYNMLKTTYIERMKKYVNNSTFQKSFKSEYESIFGNAELYLEKDPNLSNAKQLVNTLYELKSKHIPSLTSKERETYLERLHAIDLPDKKFIETYAEGELIIKYINQIEQNHLNSEYAGKIAQLKNMSATESNQTAKNQLRDLAKQTNCKQCREKAIEAISDFNKRYEKEKVLQTIHKKDSVVEISELILIDFYKKKDCISENLKNAENIKQLGSSKEFILKKWEIAVGQIERLKTKTTERIEFNTEDEVNNFVLDMENLIEDINQNIAVVCKFDFLCNSSKKEKVEEEK